MIHQTFKIHDKFQFEIKMTYKLNRGIKTRFDIDSYFFIPNNLGINKDTYTIANFFQDLQVYIRFKTPSVLLDELGNSESVINQSLKSAMVAMVHNRNDSTIREYEDQIKMYCCVLKSALRDYVDFVAHRKNRQEVELLLQKYLNLSAAVIQYFRELRVIVAVPNNEKQIAIFAFADEYLSLLIEQYSFAMLHILQDEFSGFSDYQIALKSLINSEIDYRIVNNIPSIVHAEQSNEIFLYRSSVLKKFMGGILFLTVKRQSEVQLVEHFLLAVAAGFSMVVATGIAFYSQIKLGNLTFPFFVALVVSYMFKDRIKALFQQYFSAQIRKYFYAHKERIYYNPRQTIGTCRESVDYIEDRSVPEKIQKIRDCDHMTEIENGWLGESVIRYKRSMALDPANIRKTFKNFEVQTVTDIIRFNVSSFLKKMDDPTRELFYLDQNDICHVTAERAYHINLVMVLSQKGKAQYYKRYRIILNRDGINRIEKIPVNHFNEK